MCRTVFDLRRAAGVGRKHNGSNPQGVYEFFKTSHAYDWSADKAPSQPPPNPIKRDLGEGKK